jgi:hypothetical protein
MNHPLETAPAPCAILMQVYIAARTAFSIIFYVVHAVFQLTMPLRSIVFKDSMVTILNAMISMISGWHWIFGSTLMNVYPLLRI